MTRAVPPFRADHVGSLLRPPELLAARDDFAADRIDADQLKAAEDKAIDAVVAMQRDVGLQAVTDGEFRRAVWHMDFINQIGGIGQAAGHMAVTFHNADGDIEWTPAALHVDRKLVMEKTIFGDHYQYLASVAGGLGAEADHPVAEHGALPRRPGRN